MGVAIGAHIGFWLETRLSSLCFLALRHPLLGVAVSLADSGDKGWPSHLRYFFSSSWHGIPIMAIKLWLGICRTYRIPFEEQRSGSNVSATLFGDGYEAVTATGPLKTDISLTFL